MTKKRVYASDLHIERDYIFAPGHYFQFNWDNLQSEFPDEDNKCWLVALDTRQINILLHMLSVVPQYYKNWGYTKSTLDTNSWDEIQTFVSEMELCLMSGCDVTELNTNVDRIATALESTRALLGPTDPQHTFYAFLQELEALGGSVGAGDTMMTSLQKIVDRMPTDMSLQELIDEIDALNDPKFKDILETLLYFKQLLPSFPDINMGFIWRLMGWAFSARYKHTMMSTQVFQATALRGIQNAISAFDEDATNTEEGLITEIWETLEDTPWLTTAIRGMANEAPTGTIAFSSSVVGLAVSLFSSLKTMWDNFLNSYVNQVETPVPTSTVTGQLAEIAARLQNLDTGQENSVLFAAIQGLVTALGDIDQTLEEDMSITQTNQQTVNCGGGCGGSGSGLGVSGFIPDQNPAQSAIDGTEYTQPDASSGEPPPSGWEEWGGNDGFLSYKCKAANSLTLAFCEKLYQIYELKNKGFAGSTHGMVAMLVEQTSRLADIAAGIGIAPVFGENVDHPLLVAQRAWVAQKVADYFYPTPDLGPFQIFADLRLDWLSDRETHVCDLYNAGDTDDARSAILDDVSTLLAGGDYSGYTSSEKAWATDIIEAFVLNSWLNLLFTPNTNIDGYTDASATDCGVCSPADHWDNCHAEGFDDEDSPYQIESVPGCDNSYACHAVHVYFDHDGVEYHDNPRQFTVSVASGPGSDCPGRSGDEIYFYYDSDGVLLKESATQDTQQPCNEFYILGDGTFTCTLTFTEYSE